MQILYPRDQVLIYIILKYKKNSPVSCKYPSLHPQIKASGYSMLVEVLSPLHDGPPGWGESYSPCMEAYGEKAFLRHKCG